LALPQPVMRNVAVAGFVGGFLARLFEIWLGETPHTTLLVDLVIQIILGAGAAIIFVFLVADASRSDRTRVYALALVGGFFWQPAWQAGGALVEEKQSAIAASQATAAINEAQETLDRSGTLDSTQAAEIAPKIQEQLLRAQALIQKIQRTDDPRRVNSSAASFMVALNARTSSNQASDLHLAPSGEIASTIYEQTVPHPVSHPLPVAGEDLATIYSNWLGLVPGPVPHGARVNAVVPGKAAAQAGLRHGDVILEIGSYPVNAIGDLEAVHQHLAGQSTIQVTVRRAGQVHVFELHP